MADIRFSNVRKQFGDGTVALESFSLEIPSPRLVVLVGPSGCGKTTLLRLIAGLERPTAGEIFLGESRLDTLDPRDRDVAMVFQNYALYPHMTVRENLSFGLRIRKTPRPEVDARVSEVARSLEIDSLLGRRPAELSGGQRQRVALGRAIIREPRVFLFDEPLSNLDARLRDEMRYLIKRLYQRLGTTTLYVTHDQVEAMTIGEMLVVMRSGRIHQVGTPTECYERPADRFVASFLGSPPMNFLEATLEIDRGVAQVSGGTPVPVPDAVREGLRGERRVVIGIRPEHLMIPGERCEFSLEGRVALRETLGHDTLTHVDVAGGTVIVRGRRAPAEGAVRLGIPLEHVHYFSAVGGGRLAADGPGA